MKLLLYCTKAKPYLLKDIYNDNKIFVGEHNYGFNDKHNFDTELGMNLEYESQCERLNGKIVAECDYEVEEIEEQQSFRFSLDDYEITKGTKTLPDFILSKLSCLTRNEIENYLDGENGYAIHIKNLHIFDGINDLSCFHKKVEYCKCVKCKDRCKHYFSKNTMSGETNTGCTRYYKLSKAPQNMMYVYDSLGNKYVLISIRPQWLCKILNGEKTIEVRKKVLKEML